MSIKLVKKELIKFIKTPLKNTGPIGEQGEVVVLKGPWGTGKTYFWNKIQEENISQSIFDDYSYVSLFGLNSIEEIKNQIFLNLAPTKGPKKQIFIRGVTKVSELLNRIESLNDHIKSVNNVFSYLGWGAVNNSIICFDDLERVGADLKIKDFLGLVSVIKEQKKCKVLIIMNSENILDPFKSDYKNYKEKIIDAELSYEPTYEELTEFALPSNKFFKSGEKEKFLKEIKNANIINIRTIIKAYNYYSEIRKFCSDLDQNLILTVIESIVRLTAEEWEDKAQLSKDSIKSFYDSQGVSVDHLIKPIIQKGWINETLLTDELKKISALISEKEQNSAIEEKYNKIIDTLHNSLTDNSAEIEGMILEFFETSRTKMNHLDQSLLILREINRTSSIPKIMDLHFQHENLSNLKEGIKHMRLFGRTPHETILEKEKELENLDNQKTLGTLNPAEEIKKILASMTGGKMFSRNDLKILTILPKDEIYNYLISNTITEETKSLIKQCISPTLTSPDTIEQSNIVRSKFYDIISDLTRDSKLNEKRFKWWDII